jgi:AcrR family transcriptional regulator
MTTVMPRRERLRAQTRDEILSIGRAQVAAYGEVSLRSVAAVMGVTPPALYRYFPNAGAVEDALAREVLMQAALEIGQGGWPAYVRWASTNPGLFALLARPRHTDQLAELHASVTEALTEADVA